MRINSKLKSQNCNFKFKSCNSFELKFCVINFEFLLKLIITVELLNYPSLLKLSVDPRLVRSPPLSMYRLEAALL